MQVIFFGPAFFHHTTFDEKNDGLSIKASFLSILMKLIITHENHISITGFPKPVLIDKIISY